MQGGGTGERVRKGLTLLSESMMTTLAAGAATGASDSGEKWHWAQDRRFKNGEK